MDKDFLLTTETAKKLYHEHAEKMPMPPSTKGNRRR